MKYMMLLHNDEARWGQMTEANRSEAIAAYMAYNVQLAAAGVLADGARLQPSHTTTTLRGVDGEIEVVDGPYAETREQIGGYYVLQVDDLDDALHWAKRCPAVWGGRIEVRPLGTAPSELGDASS